MTKSRTGSLLQSSDTADEFSDWPCAMLTKARTTQAWIDFVDISSFRMREVTVQFVLTAVGVW